jgi:hypothetical protein
MSLPEVVAQLVLAVKALFAASLRARMAVLSMLLHVPTVFSRPTKGALTPFRTT